MELNSRQLGGKRQLAAGSRHCLWIAVAGLMILVPGAWAEVAKTEPHMGPMPPPSPPLYALTGNLDWDGDGSIHWDGRPPAGEWGGPTTSVENDAQQGLATWRAWIERTVPGEQGGEEDMLRIRFQSDPIPETVYLNPSQLVTTRFTYSLPSTYTDGPLPPSYIPQDSPCAKFDIEVRTGDDFVGGYLRGTHSNAVPHVVDGSACRYEIAFHSEVDVLHAGSSIIIELIMHPNFPNYVPQFSFSDVEGNQIQFPLYSDAELSARRPEFRAPSSPEDSGEGNASAVVLASAVGGLWLIAPRGRAARRNFLLAVALLTVALAGCSGKNAGINEPPDEIDSQVPEVNTKTLEDKDRKFSNNATGAIAGTILDEYGQTVANAHVFLQSTSHSTNTDEYGGFVLKHLPPNTYTMSVHKEKLNAIQIDVAVTAGHITELTLRMNFPEDVTGVDRPHRHGSWPSSGVKTIFEDSVAFQGDLGQSGEGTVACGPIHSPPLQANKASFCWARFWLPDDDSSNPRVVQPGTAQMRVKLEWKNAADGALPVDRMGIAFIANNEGRGWTAMYPKENGGSTTIPVGWEMADHGHQPYSTWRFALYVPTSSHASAFGGPGPYGGNILDASPPRVMFLEGAVKVTIEIVKGVVPHERAHPDLWGDATVMEIPILPLENNAWKPEELVPPKTAFLEVSMTHEGQDPSIYDLYYKAANKSPQTPPEEYVKAEVNSTQESTRTYLIALEGHMTDYPYALESQFRFEAERNDDCLLPNLCPATQPGTVTVKAFKG